MVEEIPSDSKKSDQKKKKRYIDVKELKLSNSKISMLFQCERKFFYGYVLGLPRVERDYFILGTFVHRVLELFYISLKTTRDQSFSALMGECFKKAREETPDIDAQILAQAKDILKSHLVKTIVKRPLAPDFETEDNFEITVDGVKVIGFIDRIDHNEDGTITVLDYKTGRSAKKPKEFLDDLQLPIYALAIREKFGKEPAQMTLKLLHLRLDKEQELRPTEATLEYAKESIRKAQALIVQNYQRMEAEKWSQVSPKHLEKINDLDKMGSELENNHLIFIHRFAKFWKPTPNKFCRFCDQYRLCNNVLW